MAESISAINIGNMLTRRTYRDPLSEAVFDVNRDQRYSYDALNQRVNGLASGMRKLGVGTGDRVAILLMNGIEFIETFFALAKIGAVMVPLNWRLTADELEFMLKDSGAKALIFGPEFEATVTELHGRGDKTDIQTWLYVVGDTDESVPDYAHKYEGIYHPISQEPELSGGGDDLLFIMYTSGTTGLPKGVMHTHNTVMATINNMIATTTHGADETTLISLPLFHVGALTPAISGVYAKVKLVITRTFTPQQSWQLIQDERVTNTLLVPAMLLVMKSVYDPAIYDASSLHTLISGAAPVPVSLIEAYKDMGIAINQVYGMTETCGPGCVITGEDALTHPGSTGRGYFFTDVKIVDDKGVECPRGERGEVLMRGKHIMVGYWNRPDATSETLVDGWLHSGDVGVMDDDGFVTIVERMKDMLISGGENIYPAEIENVLLGHDGVADAAVIGIPSDKWGECPIAVIVKSDTALTEDDLIKLSQNKLARFKSLRRVVFVDTIPRNPSGKILKRVLREQFSEIKAPE